MAALTEPEPTQARTLNGITFTVADQKALLSDYHFADPATFLGGGKDAGAPAAEFHKAILDGIGKQQKGLVINAFDGSEQVASFAAYRFQSVYISDPSDPHKTHVQTTIWAAD